MKIKSFIITAVLATVIFCSAGFVNAQTATSQAQLTQQLIQILEQLIAQLTQEINAILAQQHTQTSNSVVWDTYTDSANGVTFQYPDSLSPIADLQKPSVVITPQGSSNIDSNGCLVAQDVRSNDSIVTINTINFCLETIGDAAMGSAYHSYNYTILKNGKYYTLEYVVQTSNGCGALKNDNDINAASNANYRTCLDNLSKYDSVVVPLIQQSAGTLTFINPTIAQPTITSISGPTSLVVGQTGIWTVNASGSSNLTYGVIWGDEGIGCVGGDACNEIPFNLHGQQSPTFSHVYQNSSVETIAFSVKDSSGQIASKSISVNIMSSANASIQITSPIGGETWHVGETHSITWQATGVQSVLVDLIGYYNGKWNFTMPISGTLPASSGSFSWTINDQLNSYGDTITKPGQTFMIAIQEYLGSTKSTSGYVNILAASY